MKRLVLLFLLLFPAVAFAQKSTVKVAHFDMDSLLTIMPEATTANELLIERQTLIDVQCVSMQAEYDKKKAEFRDHNEEWSPVIKMLKERELQALQQNIEEFKAMVVQDQEAFRASLFDPIKAKINAAVTKVAAQKGYAMVIDSSESMSIVLYADPAYDIFNDICIELGLKKQ